MPTPVKPLEYLDWNPSQSNVIEPPSGKKAEGWIAEEPPADYMNWLFYMSDQWIKWFDYEDGLLQEDIDDIKAKFALVYQAIVGAGDECTHATIAAALADSLVPAGSRIYVKDSVASLAAAIVVGKDNIEIEFAPGVSYVNGAAGTCFHVTNPGFRCHKGRFQGFTIGFLFDSGADYGFVSMNRFKSCTSEVTDNTSTGNIQQLGNTTEA